MADNNRIDRVLRILRILCRGERLNGRELAQRLGVNQRTIYRDILALRNNGVKINTVDGSYQIGPAVRPSPWPKEIFKPDGLW